jgi:hypothetical protein
VEHWFYLFLDIVAPRDEIEMVEAHWSSEEFAKVITILVDYLGTDIRQVCAEEKRMTRQSTEKD